MSETPAPDYQVDGLDLRHVQLALDDWGKLRDLYGLFQKGRVLAQDGVPPFRHRALLAEPVAVSLGFVSLETTQRRDDTNAARSLGTTPVEVVLGQIAHQTSSAKHERESINDRAFPGTVGTDENIMVAEPDFRALDATKAVDRERDQLYLGNCIGKLCSSSITEGPWFDERCFRH